MEEEFGEVQTGSDSGSQRLWEGRRVSRSQLSAILERHSRWLQSDEPDTGERADLGGAVLKRVNLRGANLQHANIERATLQQANLRGANLQGANLLGANLRDADLHDVDLKRAHLQGANLQGADLLNVDLQDAYLEGADLHDAQLRDVNLKGAFLQGANLADVRGLETATLRLKDLEGAILPERFARLFEDSAEEKSNMPPSEASHDQRVDTGSAPETRSDAMSTSVNIEDLVGPSIDAALPETQKRFEQLVAALKRDGLDAFGHDQKQKVSGPGEGEAFDQTWMLHMGEHHRVFVREKEGKLDVVDIVPLELIQAFGSH